MALLQEASCYKPLAATYHKLLAYLQLQLQYNRFSYQIGQNVL